jgi:hypothetical protein
MAGTIERVPPAMQRGPKIPKPLGTREFSLSAAPHSSMMAMSASLFKPASLP